MLQAEAGLVVPFEVLFHSMETVSSTHIKFGRRVKQLRKDRNLTQEDLAFKIGVDRSYMGFIERGEKNPTLKNIDKLAKAFGIKISILFDGV